MAATSQPASWVLGGRCKVKTFKNMGKPLKFSLAVDDSDGMN